MKMRGKKKVFHLLAWKQVITVMLKLSSKAAWCRIIMKDFMTPCICSKICHHAWWMSEWTIPKALRDDDKDEEWTFKSDDIWILLLIQDIP